MRIRTLSFIWLSLGLAATAGRGWAEVAPTLVWQSDDEGGSSGYIDAAGMVMGDSGEIYVAGNSVMEGPSLIRFGSQGDSASIYAYGFMGMGHRATDLARDAAGNFYIGGYVIGTQGLALKLSPLGATLWEFWQYSCGNDTYIQGIEVSAANRVYGGGYDFCSGNLDSMMLEFNTAAGTTYWQDSYDYGDGAQEQGNDVGIDSSGNVYAVGDSTYNGINLLLIKYDSTGSLQWTRTVTLSAGDRTVGERVAIDPSGNIVVAASIRDSGTGNVTGYGWAKFSSSGILVWGHTVSGDYYPRDVAVDDSGCIYYCMGRSETSATGYLVGKISGIGETLWTYTGKYSQAGFSDDPRRILLDSAGGIYLAGTAQRSGGSSLFLVKLACAPAAPPGLPSLEKKAAAYPNPASGDSLNLALKLEAAATEVEVEVYNASMQRIFRGVWHNVTVTDGGVTLSGVMNWAPGIYLVKAKATLVGGGVQEFKPVKVKVKR